jgi:hypothetical protein
MNLPLFVYELKDLPDMLRHIGDLRHGIKRPSGLSPLKEAAAANLAWKFGWDPLISDTLKLVGFAESVRRKQQELKAANSVRGLRRRINLGENSTVVNDNPLVWSTFGVSIRVNYTARLSSRTWGVVNWIARDPSAMGKAPTFTEAFKTALGLNRGHLPINIWKALPWSWMADWFLDMSNRLTASYNMIYYKPRRICIMRHTVGIYESKEASNASVKVSQGRLTTERKARYVNLSPNQNVTLRAPMLDTYKLSVLGSLAILKDKGVRRVLLSSG